MKIKSIKYKYAMTVQLCNLKVFNKYYDEQSVQFKFKLRFVSHLMKNLNIYFEIFEWKRDANNFVLIDKIESFLYVIERWSRYKRLQATQVNKKKFQGNVVKQVQINLTLFLPKWQSLTNHKLEVLHCQKATTINIICFSIH